MFLPLGEEERALLCMYGFTSRRDPEYINLLSIFTGKGSGCGNRVVAGCGYLPDEPWVEQSTHTWLWNWMYPACNWTL